MLIVLSISIAIMVLRFGMSVLKDNFVAELSTHYQNSAEFLSFYGLLNFYMYTMAFVYSPAKNAVFGEFMEQKIRRMGGGFYGIRKPKFYHFNLHPFSLVCEERNGSFACALFCSRVSLQGQPSFVNAERL